MTATVLAMPGDEDLATGLRQRLRCAGDVVGLHRFPDEEVRVTVPAALDGRHVAVVARLDRPDGRLVPALLAAAAARDVGARRVGLVAPYLPYMRQDHAFQPGQAVSAHVVARVLRDAFDWLVTVDPHLHRIRRLEDVFVGPCRTVHAGPLLARWIADHVARPVVVGPDEESEQWVADVARRVGAPHVVLRKTRRGDRDVEVSVPGLDVAGGRTPVLVDDIVSTARTMSAAVRHLRRAGFPPPACVAVHGIFAGDAYETLLAAGAGAVVTTDTVRHGTNEIPVAPLLAEAVSSLLAG